MALGCISLCANTLEKGITSSVIPPAISKWLDTVTNQERKSEFKPSVLLLKSDLISYSSCSREARQIYINTHSSRVIHFLVKTFIIIQMFFFCFIYLFTLKC